MLDLDYLFQWFPPVLPSTLIFKDCFDLSIDIKPSGLTVNLMEIDYLDMKSKIEQDKDKFVFE